MNVNIYEMQVCYYTYAYAQTWYVWTLVRMHLHDVILVQVYKSRFDIKTNQKTITLHVSLRIVSSIYYKAKVCTNCLRILDPMDSNMSCATENNDKIYSPA